MKTVFHLSGTLRGTSRNEIWIADGVIQYQKPTAECIVQEISGYIYPGLVDAHTHIGMSNQAEPVSDEEMRRRLAACAMQGVTAIRDAGSQRDANEVITTGMPKVIHCGQHIARPKRYTRFLASEVEPENFLSEIEKQCAISGGWIKIVADWIDRSAGDLRPLWDAKLFADGVALAHDLGKRVTVHSFAAETGEMLLAAGVDGIEHGTGMSFAQKQQARAQGILIVPTVNQISRFPEFAAAGHRFPIYQKRMREMDARRREHLAELLVADSLLVMGSDTAEDVATPGRGLPQELVDAVRDGMPTELVMAAASYRGRELLGFTSWEEGSAADFVVYRHNPERDINEVLHPQRVIIDGLEVGSF
ncbi:MAG: amidohydrolase family protein [Arcanobacterium sp.]|nr:amidohydrolase family protein [Arcanobacterium sp.]